MSTVLRTPGSKMFPATKIQRAYFVGRQPDLPMGGMECVALLSFTGPTFDEDKLRQAINSVSALPALRVRFINAEQLTEGEVWTPELKIHHLPRANEAEHTAAVRERMFAHSISLSLGRLWDVELTHWHDGESMLHIAISLAAVDLVGISALMHHFSQAYRGVELSTACISIEQLYQRLNDNQLHIERKRQAGQERLNQLAQRCMAALPPPPELPFTTYSSAGESLTNRVVRRSRFYDAQQWARIEEFAAQLNVASSALVLALYTRALRQYSAIADFMVTITNIPILSSGSEMEPAERTVAFAHRSRKLQSLEAMACDAHDSLRYLLLRGIDCETELRSALSDTSGTHPGISPYIFTYAMKQPVFNNQVTDIFNNPCFWGQTPQSTIDCQVLMLTEQRVEVAFDVRRVAIPEDVANGVFELFTESLDDVIAGHQPERTLPRAAREWRNSVNLTARASAPDMLFSGFRRQVQIQPQATALISPAADADLAPELRDPLLPDQQERQWSYAELDKLALRLAARLATHAAAEDIIGIRLPKGPAQIVAVLAVLYAGCTYLPVGLDMPEQRLDKIRQRSGMRYLLTAADFDQIEQQTPLVRPRTSGLGANPEALAYVIFTSGSTGEPKGVAVSHRAANNTIVDVNTRHRIARNDALLAISSLDFDLSAYDIFGPFSAGASIVTISENERRDAFSWAARVNAYRVTLWNSVPALAAMLSVAADSLPSVRTWLCSGDWVAPSLFADLQKIAPGSVLVAMGGSTEAAIWSNEFVIRSAEDLKAHWASVPYGLPLSGQQYRVMREDDTGQFNDCPDGVTGELWIGGEGLAQGYLSDPERTSERFIQLQDTPQTGMSRWYRTGDLGYWREGLLFFVGRQDTQVKIQGHRVECGEIERILTQLPGINNAVVVPIRERRALGAVVVGWDIVPEQVRQHLARQLPYYMIPALLLVRDRLALSQNGKIDRKWALNELAHEERGVQRESDPTASALFTACLAVWRQVLNREDISAGDNFFALGGDSLAATRVCALLLSQGVAVSVGELFAGGTLEVFATQCQPAAVVSEVNHEVKADPANPFALTSLQQAYALGADGIPGVSRCDTVFSVILSNPSHYSVAHWQQSLNALIRETAVLRLVRTEAQQQIVGPHAVGVVMLAEGEDLQAYLSDTPLDARTYPPLSLVAVEGESMRIGLMCNYLGLDALSLIRVILALGDRVTGVESGYRPESHIAPFMDYVAHKAGTTAPCDTWDDAMWQPPSLPAARDMSRFSRIKSLPWHLGALEQRTLEEQAQRDQVTLSALILQALSESLVSLCDSPQVVVVVPICWRPPGSPQALGQFTQLRLCRYTANTSVAEVSRELGDAVAGRTPDDRYIAARGRAVYPFVFTSMVGIPEVETLNQRQTRIIWSHTRTPGVLIDCQVLPKGDGLEIRWDYAAGILDESQLMAAHRLFVSTLMQEPGEQEEQEAVSAMSLGSEPPIAELSGHQIARLAMASALQQRIDVPEVLRPVIDAWKQRELAAADPAWREAGQFLASCVNGTRTRNSLLAHPFLAPERLFLSSLRQCGFLSTLMASLRTESAQRSPVDSELRVLILGAGSGAFGQALTEHAAACGLSLQLDEYEGNEALNALASYRPPLPEEIPDVVIAPASLHRDEGLLTRLTELCQAESRAKPVVVHVLEVTEPDEASLISALLDPTLVDNGPSPLITASAWGQRLERAGAELEQMQRPAHNLVWIKATLPVAPRPDVTQSHVIQSQASAEVEEQVAACWASVLGVSTPIAPSADFFTLGGDSMGATQIVMALRQQGLGAIRLADLFNYPNFANFVARVQTLEVATEELPHVSVEPVTLWPLTALQKAYLAGRSPDQLLGGVASHCYFEFLVDEPEGIDIARWQQAVRQVVARYDALRSRIVWQDGNPFGYVSLGADCLPEVCTDVRALTEAETPDPVHDYPLRVRLSPDGKTIGIGMDNLMLDGSSMFLVMSELGAIYQGKSLPAPPAMSFAQYRRLNRETVPLTTELKVMPPAPDLPWLNPLVSITAMRFARSARDIDPSLWQLVRQCASQHRVTPVALLLAAYALEVADIALQPEFSLNVTTFERDLDVPDVASLVGDFTQLGLVAFAPKPPVNYSEARTQRLLDQAQVAHQGLLAIHESIELVSTLRIARETVRAQGVPSAGLFPVVFTSGLGLNASTHRSDAFGFGTMTYARSQTPQVAMDFQVHDDIRGLHITVDYVTALLAAEQVEALSSGVVARIQELVANAAPPKRETSSLSAAIERIWRSHLPVTQEQAIDNFFQSGGDSLQATRCIRALQTEIAAEISLRMLLVYPRLSDFCDQVRQLIAQHEREQTAAAPGVSDFEEGML